MICLIVLSISIFPQEGSANYLETEIDNSISFEIDKSFYDIPVSRIPEVDEIKKYNQDSRFHYEQPETKKPDTDSNWFLNGIAALFKAIATFFTWIFSSGILTFVVIVLIVFVVLVIVMKVAKIDLRQVFDRKKKANTNEIDILTGESENANFDLLIQEAIDAGNLRKAIRYMYLRNLKALSDKNYINWAENKTNYSYQNEIQDRDIRDRFLATTILFDYIWYGEFPLDQSSYMLASRKLEELNKMIADGK